MPYNLRRKLSTPSQNNPRQIPIPRHGDRVMIFWNTLGTTYTGTLTRYDPVHATFLVVYDSTPSGFDDHRVWEALDLVPWRFETPTPTTMSDDVRDWFQPGELGSAHPRFRATDDSGSSGTDSDGDEEVLDGSDGEIGDDENGQRENDQDENMDTCDDDEFVEEPIFHNDEPRRAGSKQIIPRNTGTAQAEALTQNPPQRERHIQQSQQENLQGYLEEGSDYDSNVRENLEEISDSDDSLRDSLYHPPLAPTSQPRRNNVPQSPREMSDVQNRRTVISDHPKSGSDNNLDDSLYQPPVTPDADQMERQVALGEEQTPRAQTRQLGNVQQLKNDSDDSMEDSLYRPPLPTNRSVPTIATIQPTEQTETQVVPLVRRGHQRQIGDAQGSKGDSANILRSSPYQSLVSEDRHAKRRKLSAQERLQQTNRQVHRFEETNYSQPEQHRKQRSISDMRPSQNGSKRTSEAQLCSPPVSTQRATHITNPHQHDDEIQAGPARALTHDRGSSSASARNPHIVSSKNVLGRNIMPLAKPEPVGRMQPGVSARHGESKNIFDGSHYETHLAPKREAGAVSSIRQAQRYRPPPKREVRCGEKHHNNHELGKQQEPEDIRTENISNTAHASDGQETIHGLVQETSGLHYGERRKADPKRGSKVGSGCKLREKFDRPSMVSHGEPSQTNEHNPLQQQAANLQGHQEPRRRRRYANFGPPGFTYLNREMNAHPTQQNNGTGHSYSQDTVHINVSRELQSQREGPSTPSSQGAFRVSTGYHVPHSDTPSIEDQIRSITKTLGVTGGRLDEQKKD